MTSSAHRKTVLQKLRSAINQRILATLCLSASIGLGSGLFTSAANAEPKASTTTRLSSLGRGLARSTPEAEGVDSAGLLALLDGFERQVDAVHSLIVVRHGKVVVEGWWGPYRAEDTHLLYSLTKSFTSSAVGFAAQEGLLHVNDTVISHFKDLVPADVSENMQKMRIRDLLRMASGHQDDSMAMLRASDSTDWTRAFFSTPVPHRPGTHFRYNSGATYMLAAIVQKVSGQTLEQYLQPRLFGPLGITSKFWGLSPEGVNFAAGGLMVRTEAIAKFGLLYLQGGKWNGQQLLAPSWVKAATSLQMATGSDPDSNWDHGYGYQFWRNKVHGYRADGAQGQFSMVLPFYDTVVAITSGTSDMAAVMDTVWQYLIPALSPRRLAANPVALAALKTKLSSLRLPVQTGANSSVKAGNFAGKLYKFAKNDQGLNSAQIDLQNGQVSLTLQDEDGSHTIDCGFGKWIRGRTGYKKHISSVMDVPEQGIAASCGWTEDNVLTAQLCFDQTPYTLHTRFKFSGDKLFVDMTHNLRWGEKKRKRLFGKR